MINIAFLDPQNFADHKLVVPFHPTLAVSVLRLAKLKPFFHQTKNRLSSNISNHNSQGQEGLQFKGLSSNYFFRKELLNRKSVEFN